MPEHPVLPCFIFWVVLRFPLLFKLYKIRWLARRVPPCTRAALLFLAATAEVCGFIIITHWKNKILWGGYWNRPELIRDYDTHTNRVRFCVDHYKLKQTWIDKGLRHVAINDDIDQRHLHWNRPELIRDYDTRATTNTYYTSRLKQTWIDKGLRLAHLDHSKTLRCKIETDLNW